MGVLFLLFIVGSMIWVIFDSANRPQLRRGEWITGVILLWIVFFPWYLFHRRGFPKEAPLVRVAEPARFLPPVSGATPVQQLPPPGWIDDPERPGTQRWWTGQQWADHSRSTPRS